MTPRRLKRIYFICCIIVTIVLLGSLNDSWELHWTNPKKTLNTDLLAHHVTVHDTKLTNQNHHSFPQEEIEQLSQLGKRLFLDEDIKHHGNKSNYKIVIWKHGVRLSKRHIRSFGEIDLDPFELCSVKNCVVSYNDSDVGSADAVLFHLQLTKGVESLPKTRQNWQRWVFLTDESPYHTFLTRGSNGTQHMNDYNLIFNWSMHYRTDADVPVPYGRSVKLNAPTPELATLDHAKNKTRFVAIMGSNCGGQNKRWKYVKTLQKYINVDIYGKCGPLKCKGHYGSPCPVLSEYKFYLAFENSNCNQYITEKVFMHGYNMSTVPVVLGTRKSDYEKLLPPKSFIHIDDFESPKALASYLVFLNSSDTHYNEYFEWKSNHVVLNEHGYSQTRSWHYCRLCEALSYNDLSPKVYDNLEDIWSVKKSCYPYKKIADV